MSDLSALWWVRGCVPIPAEANDAGLLSRVADIFEQADAEIIEEQEDRILFQGPYQWHHGYPVGRVGIVDGGQVRRDGAMLHYQLRTLYLTLQALILTPLFALLLCAVGFHPAFVLAIMLGALLFNYAAPLVIVRLSVGPFLRRAFEP